MEVKAAEALATGMVATDISFYAIFKIMQKTNLFIFTHLVPKHSVKMSLNFQFRFFTIIWKYALSNFKKFFTFKNVISSFAF